MWCPYQGVTYFEVYGVRCPSIVQIAGRLREHFMYPHFQSKVVVVQEGSEPLPRCYLCGIHMLAGRFIRHRRTARCKNNTQIRWQIKDVAIAARCLEATFR